MRRDVQPLGDFLVAQPLADEVDDLALAAGHAHVLEHSRFAFRAGFLGDLRKERLGHPRRQHLLARGHRTDGGDELIERRILEHEARHPGIHELDDLLVHREEVHHDDPGVGMLLFERGGDPQAVLVAQPHVEQQDVRLEFRHRRRIGDVR